MKNINQKQKPKLALEIPSTVGDINQLEFFDIEEKERKVYEKFLVAKNMSTIREVPYEPVKVFTLDRSMVRERKREDYLLVGFDTEYQPMQEVFTNKDVKDKIARYEVLSYQFFAIASDGSTWSGIAIPDAGCRLTFAQFMIYVLAAGAHRGHVISQHIVLVGHYNRADVPAFDDRDQVYEHVRNVRNSLVTQGVPITLEVSFSEDKTDTMDLKVYLRDTMLLAPAGKQSLESLGGLVGKEKMTLSDKAADELFLKKRMKFVRDNKWPLFRQYAILDAEISALYFKEVTRIYQRATGRKFVPTVLSSIGMELLQAEWKARVPSVETTEMVGQELHSEEVWNDKTAQFNTKKFKPYIEQIHWHIDFATECYHGGRSEQLWFGPSFEDDWSDYDLTSAYPIAMATIGKPDWGSIFPTTDLSTFSMDAFGFACVDFRFPEGTRYPTLPIRSPHGIIFPLAGRSYCSTPEIHLALDLGCEMQVRHGVVIPQDLNSKVFFPFIKDSIRRRREAKESGSEVGEKFWKEVSNSCYGKTAQGLREKRVFGLRTKRNERIGPSAISNPFYAAYITSFVRAAIGELMNSLPTNRMVFSVTTDGFTTNATAAEMEDAKTGPIMKLYRETVLALTGKDEAVSEKHAVKQLLGWRMRGQATLKPGDATDDKRIVLAKAGVRPPMEYKTPEEQNDYMVDLFFRRTPEMRSDIEVFTTMSDMIMHGADLVRKMTSKRLSMEYDFKRCPSAVGLAEVTLAKSGKIYEHIAFNTKPWRDVTEFKMVRAMWEDYRRGEKVCMTTIKHFSDFAEFFEMMKSLPDGSQKYLRRKDKTGLQRLRRDICRAYKHGEAGFPKEPQLSARELAELLNSTSMQSHGIKTEIEDVENGKRTAFKPHTSPPTKEVLRVLRELKGTFPGLDDAALVGAISPDQVMLSAALRTECQFIDQLVAPSHDDGP